MTASNLHNLPIAVDAMGGDRAPESVVAGACAAVRQGAHVVLMGDEALLSPLISQESLGDLGSLRVQHTDQAVGMDEAPLASLRDKPRASITRALESVEQGLTSGAVSFGNSGAVLLEAVRTLRLLPGVDRPALAVQLPTRTGSSVVLLDVGANVDAKADQLVGFAQLGVAWARCGGISHPTVGVLSNGEERRKGNQLVRDALDLLEKDGFPASPVEPGPMMDGQCDVVVCDGFVGNVLIKGMEAAADLLRPGVTAPSAVPGRPDAALLLGVRGLVLAGHGASDPAIIARTVLYASKVASDQVLARFASELTRASG
ncbi:MAG: phosphate--acyl-ACP acyltransferase [Myxococcota bacterium]